MKETVNIALIGCGNVGRKVAEMISKNANLIKQKIGCEVRMNFICDIEPERVPKDIQATIVTDYQRIISDRGIDIVIELVGGKDIAKRIIIDSLNSGKNVVTANKEVLASYWDEIFTTARRNKKLVYFEAAVGAGIPIVQALNEGLAANKINRIIGILNGTTNYILTKMLEERVEFETALGDAKRKGIAEKDPSLDISGKDTLHKICILSAIAWAANVPINELYCRGIDDVTFQDIDFISKEFGYTLKLLGIADKKNGKVNIQVRPCLVPQNHPFASVRDEYNAILVCGDPCGDMFFYGKGAGGGSAASAVVSDIMFLARQVMFEIAGKIPYVKYEKGKSIAVENVDETYSSYYIRFTTVDEVGVLSKITSALAKNGISIASISQKLKGEGGDVPILMLTHKTKERNLNLALNEISCMDFNRAKPVYYKIQEF